MITYKLLGSGGVCPLPNRNLTSLFIQVGTTQCLVDCGEGTQKAARDANVSLFNLDFMFLTHFHADHTLGLPGLLMTLSNAKRTKPLIIFGPPGLHAYLNSIMKLIVKLGFEVKSFELQEKDVVQLNDFAVTAFPLKHSSICYGYSFSVVRYPEYNQDLVNKYHLPPSAISALQDGYSIEFNNIQIDIHNLFGENRRVFRLVYATDTGFCQSLVDNCRGADIAILDASYADASQIAKSNENASEIHMTFEQAATVARDAGVGDLVLTHFSPTIGYPEKSLAAIRSIFPNTFCAYTGYGTDADFKFNMTENNTVFVDYGVMNDFLHNGCGFFTTSNNKNSSSDFYLRSKDNVVLVRVESAQSLDYVCRNNEQQGRLLMFAHLTRIVKSGGDQCA